MSKIQLEYCVGDSMFHLRQEKNYLPLPWIRLQTQEPSGKKSARALCRQYISHKT